MATRIRWLGGAAVVSGAALVALLAQAAPGDPVFVERLTVTLSGAQRTGLANWITATWPSAVPATLQSLRCDRTRAGGIVQCNLVDQRTKTAAEFLVEDEAGRVLTFVSASGGNVTYDYAFPQKDLTAPEAAGLVTWVRTVWASEVLDTVLSLGAHRQGANSIAQLERVTTATAANYVAGLQAGTVVRRLGTAE